MQIVKCKPKLDNTIKVSDNSGLSTNCLNVNIHPCQTWLCNYDGDLGTVKVQFKGLVVFETTPDVFEHFFEVMPDD